MVDTEESRNNQRKDQLFSYYIIFFYTVFHDPIGRSSERTHNQKKQTMACFNLYQEGGRKGLAGSAPTCGVALWEGGKCQK